MSCRLQFSFLSFQANATPTVPFDILAIVNSIRANSMITGVETFWYDVCDKAWLFWNLQCSGETSGSGFRKCSCRFLLPYFTVMLLLDLKFWNALYWSAYLIHIPWAKYPYKFMKFVICIYWSPRVKNRHLITLKSVQSKYQGTFKVLINHFYNGCFLYCNAFLWFHTLYFYSQCVHIRGTFDQCTKAHIIYYLSSHFSNGSWQPHTLCINQGSFFKKKN